MPRWDPRRGGPDERAALPVRAEFFESVRAPGSYPRTRAARRARAFGGRDAAGGRDRAGEPLPTVGGLAGRGLWSPARRARLCTTPSRAPEVAELLAGLVAGVDVGVLAGRSSSWRTSIPALGDRVDGTAWLSFAIPLHLLGGAPTPSRCDFLRRLVRDARLWRKIRQVGRVAEPAPSPPAGGRVGSAVELAGSVLVHHVDAGSVQRLRGGDRVGVRSGVDTEAVRGPAGDSPRHARRVCW